MFEARKEQVVRREKHRLDLSPEEAAQRLSGNLYHITQQWNNHTERATYVVESASVRMSDATHPERDEFLLQLQLVAHS